MFLANNNTNPVKQCMIDILIILINNMFLSKWLFSYIYIQGVSGGIVNILGGGSMAIPSK